MKSFKCRYLPLILLVIGLISTVVALYLMIIETEKLMTGQVPENYIMQCRFEDLFVIVAFFYGVALIFILDKLEKECEKSEKNE
mgnify:CR=1 FL=1